MSNFDDYSYPYIAYASSASNACVGNTTNWNQCDGKSTVFYNGCCRRRNSPCGFGGYLGQVADNSKYGQCIGSEEKWRNPVTAGIIDTITGKQSREQQLHKEGSMKGEPAGPLDIITPTKPIVEEAVHTLFPASNDEYQSEICAKQCGFLDLFCYSAKLQAACGGTTGGCFGMGIPNVVPTMGDMGCYIVPGIVGVLLLLIFMRIR